MKRNFLKAAAASVFIALSSPASALTFVLDFDTIGSSDIFGSTTNAFNSTPFGFSGLNDTEIKNGVLQKVENHFRQYPTVGLNPSSPLPVGQELDIDFVIGSIGNAPSNMDTEYYFMQIGTAVPANPGLFGQACLSCVRNAAGSGPNFGVTTGAVVGSIYTDAISSIAGLAADNDQLFNLIAGTTSHEIAHALSLEHAGAQAANPGESAWGVMGSGATSMPNSQRVLDREFTYAKFGQLIGAVGLRDVQVTPNPNPVPLPAMGWALLAVCAGFGAYGRRSTKKAA
ncbi:hypothetical protein [uncultured Tateyamaria sp.]|uniref:hypothetical protein n=1 Tax=uncultured Tateyamaria sp. TaxID=455651 RepID=UPI00260F33A4|nr:hypothetical protein [uncultured Tateyamaria sp.]